MNLFLPGFGTISEDGVATFWGDGTRPIETTSVEDTARMTARVALERFADFAARTIPAPVR